MMTLSCKDMGQADCNFVAEGETMDDVMKTMMDHGMSAHGMTEADMMAPEKMEMAKSMVKEM